MKKVIIFLAVVMLLISASALYAQGVQNVELHGYMQNRYSANPDGLAKFAVERVSLQVTGKLPENRIAYVEIYFHPTAPSPAAEQYRTYVESAYIESPFAGGKLRFGKGRQQNFGIVPTYGSRKTTQYGLLAETFTQDRIIGMQYMYKKNKTYIGASVYSDLRIGSRNIGDLPVADAQQIVPHWAERDVPANSSGKSAASLKVGYEESNWSAHVSGSVGALNQNNLAAINAPYGTTSTNTKHNKFGVDATFNPAPFFISGEYYEGTFSFLKVKGWQLIAGYEPKDKTRFYVKYGLLDYNQGPVEGVAATFEPRQLMFGVVQPISKGLWAEVNYEKNTENGGGVKDDLFVFEVFTAF